MCFLFKLKKSFFFSVIHPHAKMYRHYAEQVLNELLGVMIMAIVMVAFFVRRNACHISYLHYKQLAAETQLRLDLG